MDGVFASQAPLLRAERSHLMTCPIDEEGCSAEGPPGRSVGCRGMRTHQQSLPASLGMSRYTLVCMSLCMLVFMSICSLICMSPLYAWMYCLSGRKQTNRYSQYAMGKAVANHADVRGSIPSTDVGKKQDREIFSHACLILLYPDDCIEWFTCNQKLLRHIVVTSL